MLEECPNAPRLVPLDLQGDIDESDFPAIVPLSNVHLSASDLVPPTPIGMRESEQKHVVFRSNCYSMSLFGGKTTSSSMNSLLFPVRKESVETVATSPNDQFVNVEKESFLGGKSVPIVKLDKKMFEKQQPFNMFAAQQTTTTPSIPVRKTSSSGVVTMKTGHQGTVKPPPFLSQRQQSIGLMIAQQPPTPLGVSTSSMIYIILLVLLVAVAIGAATQFFPETVTTIAAKMNMCSLLQNKALAKECLAKAAGAVAAPGGGVAI